MSAEAFDRIAQVLKEANKRYPNDAFVDRRRLSGLLADHIGDADSQIRVVMNAIQDGAAEQLVQAPDNELSLHVNRLAGKLERAWGLKPEIALSAIQACAYAVGRGPLPSQSVAAPAAATADDWVGLSQVVTPTAAAAATSAAQHKHEATRGGTVTPTGGASSAKDWLKNNQKLAAGGAAVLALLIYFGNQAPPAPTRPASPATSPIAQPSPPGPAPQPSGGQPQAPGPQPQQPALPPSANPNQPQRPTAPGGQTPSPPQQGRQMAWYDDNSVKWDVILGGNGEFIARLTQNGAAYTMKGEIANNTVTYKIFDGRNQQVGLGGGVVQDARHLNLTTNDMSGRALYSGKIHVDHLPGS